jgi:predicted ArsR family transcriptional regulator
VEKRYLFLPSTMDKIKPVPADPFEERAAAPGAEARLHRALGDPSRVRIVELLRAADAPLDAAQIAERVGLHPNTVRSHLRVLAGAGLVSLARENRRRPGRPRIVYGITPDGALGEEPGGYRLLAEILASYLASSGLDSTDKAEAAGEAWGRYLVDRRPPFAAASPDDDIEAIVRLLREAGFDPAVESAERGHTLLMQHCPFGEVAESYRKVVCSVHLGLIQGALVELGAHVEADDLQPFARPGVCAAHLEEVLSNA